MLSYSTSSFDQSWYLDSSATNCLTQNLNNLIEHTTCIDIDCVQWAMVKVLPFKTSVSLFFSSPFHSKLLALKSLLRVPMLKKNLSSVSKFAKNNNVYFEFFPNSCFVKD